MKEAEYKGENTKPISFMDRVMINKGGKPYLDRLTFLSIYKWLSIKYHKIMQSDGNCDHNHPWVFMTIILSGGYYEWTPRTQNDSGETVAFGYGVDGEPEVCKWHGPGSIMFRGRNWRHRLALKDGKPARTFVITGPELKDWGFFTKSGWIFWENKFDEEREC